ncbi:hypothetical protein [Streptomyces sp. NPDC057250]|uniref:hypothetical protein n=1 Tax=Streptomyces sp. NPDC057250 TaxID=3346068 RepID=UPI00362F848E
MSSPNQQRTPGVRYRQVKRERYVDVEFAGEVKRRKETYYEWVPVPPVNLDRLYLRAVVGVAVMLTLVAAVWSTTAIGRLLGGMVPGHEEVGYIGAVAFEVPWIACLMVQWILRDQPERAKPVIIAGWIGLGIVVGTVVIDGINLNMPEVGAVAAFISVVAKGLWWVVLRLFHVPLDDDHAGWLDAKRQEMAVSRVMLGEKQRMGAMEAWMAEVYGTQPGAAPIVQRVQPPELAPAPAPAPQPAPDPAATTAPVTVTMSTAPVAPVAPSVPPVPAPVAPAAEQQVTAPATAPAPPVTPAPQQDGDEEDLEDTESEEDIESLVEELAPKVFPVGGPFKSDTIRAAIDQKPGISNRALVRLVEKVHGKDPATKTTVTRTRRRIEAKRKSKEAS